MSGLNGAWNVRETWSQHPNTKLTDNWLDNRYTDKIDAVIIVLMRFLFIIVCISIIVGVIIAVGGTIIGKIAKD